MQLYINDINIDLPKNFTIPRTKQVNTFNRLDNRQANYTLSVRIPKTKNNIKALNYLGNEASLSNKPYEYNKAQLFNSNGDCEIFDGFVVIKSTDTDSYNISIYDGFISFTKAIENMVLSDIVLTELNHLKNITTVKDTWIDSTKPYRYNVADYNGNAIIDGRLNTDFLIPSVNVKYLWDKVHEFFGYTYEGSLFDTQDFRDLWITYPKAVNADTQQVLNVGDFVYDGDTRYYSTDDNDLNIYKSKSLTANLGGTNLSNDYLQGHTFNTGGFPIGSNDEQLNNVGFTVLTTGTYKITIKGTFFSNGSGVDGDQINLYYNSVPTNIHDITNDEYFELVHYINLSVSDNFSLSSYLSGFDNADIDVKIEFVTGNAVDFQEALLNFSIKDFINEIMYRHGLTPFISKYEKKIEYLTFAEWFNTGNVLDWSADKDKYVRTVKESYIVGNYGKRSYLRYRYNDDNSSHHDSYLIVQNENLPDSVDVIQSKLFAPESKKSIFLTDFFATEYNTYPIWSKEPKDDGIEYKALDNRFYIMRSIEVNDTIDLKDESTGQTDTTSIYFREDFERLGFNEIQIQYYEALYSVLVQAKKYSLDFYINDKDINDLDFKKLIYVKEKASYFILSKIPNYIDQGVYTCECVKVNIGIETPNEVPLNPEIILSSNALYPNASSGVFFWAINSQYVFVDYVSTGATITAKQLDSYTPPLFGDPSTEVVGNYTGFTLSEVLDVTIGNQSFVFDNGVTQAQEGWYEVQILDINGLLSNKQYVRIETTESTPPPAGVNGSLWHTNGVNDPNKEIRFAFTSFTPAFCNIRIIPWNWLGEHPTGQPEVVISVPSGQLTPDTQHIIPFVSAGTGWFYLIMETDTESIEGVRLCV